MLFRRAKELLEGEVKICIFLKTNEKNKAKFDTYSYLHPKHCIIVFAQLFLFLYR